MKIFVAVAALAIASVLFFSFIPYTHAHQLFNSEEKRIAGYIIQVATDPEIPNINSPSKIMFKVMDREYSNVNDANLGVRIYKDDALLKEVGPRSLNQGHLDMDYTFTSAGIHFVEVDLYTHDGRVIKTMFNVGTMSPFGYIFYAMVMVGVLLPLSIFLFLFVTNKIKRKRSIA